MEKKANNFIGTGYCSLYKKHCMGNLCSADNYENKCECCHYARQFTWIPDMEDLECINGWPSESCGFLNDKNAILDILELCKKHGFGRVSQLANQIEKIWRNPEKIMELRKEREEYLKIFDEIEGHKK
jgi:hypothetical protein